MSELERLEQELRQQIDRRLDPGERTQLLKKAGKQFTLGFEFGKDWVRLREVKRSKKPPPDDAEQPDEQQVDDPVAVTAAPVAVAAINHLIPEDPWQAIDNGGFQLGEHDLATLQPEADGRWHLLGEGQPVATSLPLDDAIVSARQWVRSQLQDAGDAVEFARVQLEVMQDNADEAAVAEQQKQVIRLQQRHQQLQAAAGLITDDPA